MSVETPLSAAPRTTLDGWRPLPGDRVKVVMNAGMASEGRTLAQALAQEAPRLEHYAVRSVVRSHSHREVTRYVVASVNHELGYVEDDWCVLVEVPRADQLALF